MPNLDMPSHEYSSSHHRRKFIHTSTTTPPGEHMPAQNQPVIYQTQVQNMNFNVALDAKSLNSMTQSGKFNFRHFK